MTDFIHIKVCGMREAANIAAVCTLPIHYIGFIFYEASPRYVGEGFEKSVAALVPPNIQKVGVFLNADYAHIANKVQQYELHAVQLHGEESPFLCEKLLQDGLVVIKAFAVDADFDFNVTKKYEQHCHFFLFDTLKKGQKGGTGASFDWSLLSNYKQSLPYFLSGGISISNINSIDILKDTNLYGVDINSRFEDDLAIKNVKQIAEFAHLLAKNKSR